MNLQRTPRSAEVPGVAYYGGNAVLEIVHPSRKTNGTPHEIGRFDRYFEIWIGHEVPLDEGSYRVL